jgi:hypothetical protein
MQDSLTFLFAQAMRNQASTAFTAVLAVPITRKGTPPAFEGAQGNAEFTAGANQSGASGIRLDDQLDRHPPLGGTRQPSSSSEQKVSHFFRSTSNAAASARAFSLRCSSFYSFGEAFG